jgi:hypothetical protein
MAGTFFEDSRALKGRRGEVIGACLGRSCGAAGPGLAITLDQRDPQSYTTASVLARKLSTRSNGMKFYTLLKL